MRQLQRLLLQQLRIEFAGTFFSLLLFLQILTPEAIARGNAIRHQVRVNDTADAIQTQGLCRTIQVMKRRSFCLPLGYRIQPKGKVNVDVLLKAQDEALMTLKRVDDENVDQKWLESIFSNSNFQEASGIASASAIFNKTALTYTPFHFLGGYKLNNPSLPVVDFAAIRQRELRLSQYLDARTRVGRFLFAPSVYGYERNHINASFDMISLSVEKPSKLIKKKKQRGLDGDASVSFLSRYQALPSVSLRGYNLVQKYECEDCKSRALEVESIHDRSTEVASWFNLRHPIGSSMIGATLPFIDAYKELNTQHVSGSYVFIISNMQAFAAYSSLKSSFGFMFDSKFYRIGIQYANEKQPNRLEFDRKEKVYFFTSLYL